MQKSEIEKEKAKEKENRTKQEKRLRQGTRDLSYAGIAVTPWGHNPMDEAALRRPQSNIHGHDHGPATPEKEAHMPHGNFARAFYS